MEKMLQRTATHEGFILRCFTLFWLHFFFFMYVLYIDHGCIGRHFVFGSFNGKTVNYSI